MQDPQFKGGSLDWKKWKNLLAAGKLKLSSGVNQ